MKIVPLVIAVRDGTVEIEGECVVSLRLAAVSPRDALREEAFLGQRELEHRVRPGRATTRQAQHRRRPAELAQW